MYVETGQFAKALADIDKYNPDNTPWERVYVLGRSGRPAEAQRAMEGLRQLNRRYPVDPAAFAWAYLGMGKKDETLASLDKAYARHSNHMDTLKVEPGMGPAAERPAISKSGPAGRTGAVVHRRELISIRKPRKKRKLSPLLEQELSNCRVLSQTNRTVESIRCLRYLP